jgi:GT2 family glycosyltransferase
LVNEGLTVLIPERGRPDMLAATLESLDRALQPIDSPHSVLIVVNGSPRSAYRELQRSYPAFHWQFHARALGFHGAVAAGLEGISEKWVYLLNSDMRLAQDALLELLPWRSPATFAIASCIEFADSRRRREETGYTLPVIGPDGQLELHDVLPPDQAVRTHLYAGGGASLFQAAPLRRYLRSSRCYAPFYFEDADWAMQAWADGLQVLHCPASRAVHQHRATIGHFYSEATIERILQRNLAQFRWRYGDLFEAPRWHGGRGDRLAAWWRARLASHRRARQRVCSRLSALRLQQSLQRRLPRPARPPGNRPRVLLVSPFLTLPPAHGGARRIVELARSSAERIDWFLLQDEAPADNAATRDDAPFCEIQSVRGRPRHGPEDRWEAHAHAALRDALRCAIERLQPDLICLEHAECLGLVDELPASIPRLWTFHDAGRQLPLPVRQKLQAAAESVDALILTVPEDLGCLAHPRQFVIRNGVRPPDSPLRPSPDDGHVLMVAPLRYGPNLDGLGAFLQRVWQPLRVAHPTLRLRVLGGLRALELWGDASLPAGIELVDGYVDPTESYADAVVAINPQRAVEGSALKIAESLAHRRLMVSTRDGARGYDDLHSPALMRVDDVAGLLPALQQVLGDPDQRHRAESSGPGDIRPWHWQAGADRLVTLIGELLRA